MSNKTKIFSELESGVPDGYVTSISQISGAESIYKPILISAPELRKKAFLRELVPEQRYIIKDYSMLSPAYSEYMSTLGVAPRFLSDFRILVRAVSNSSLSEDAKILCRYEEIGLLKGFDNWKIKYDLWGIKHILSKFNTIETYSVAGGTTDAHGDPYTLFYSPETDLAFYQPGNRLASPKFDLPCRISTFCQEISRPDFNELNTPTPSFSLDEILSSFHAHRGVITYMCDDRGNEAYCDFINFHIIYHFFSKNPAPLIHISPYIAPPEVVDCQNNKIGPYYREGFLSFPPVMIGPFAEDYMGSSSAPMFTCKDNTITNIEGELMLCGSNNIIDHSGGYYYGNNNNISHSVASGSFFNSTIKHISLLDNLHCSESDFSSIASCQINNSALDNVQMPFAGKSTGLRTFHINGSNLKNSTFLRKSDSTSIEIIRSTIANCNFDVFCDDLDDRGCIDVVIKGISDGDRLVLKNCNVSRCITLVSHTSSVSFTEQVISRSSIVIQPDLHSSESAKIIPYESFSNIPILVKYTQLLDMSSNGTLVPNALYDIVDYHIGDSPFGCDRWADTDDFVSIIRVKAIDNFTLSEDAEYIVTDDSLSGNSYIFKAKYTLHPIAPYRPDQPGVILWLQDNLGNEAPFDFYRIAFKFEENGFASELSAQMSGLDTNNMTSWLSNHLFPLNNPDRALCTNNVIEYKFNQQFYCPLVFFASEAVHGIAPPSNNKIEIDVLGVQPVDHVYFALGASKDGCSNNHIRINSLMSSSNPAAICLRGSGNIIENSYGHIKAVNSTFKNSTVVCNSSIASWFNECSITNSEIICTILKQPDTYFRRCVLQNTKLLGINMNTQERLIAEDCMFLNCQFPCIADYIFDAVRTIFIGKCSPKTRLEQGLLDCIYKDQHYVSYDNLLYSSKETALPVTHEEFETMRRASALIPGCYYRITDHTSSNISKIYIGEGIFTATALVRYDLVIKAISSDAYDVNASIAEHQFSEDPSFLDSVTIAPTYIEDYSKYKVTVEYLGATAPSIILAELPNGGPQVPFINTYESIQVSGGTVSNRYTLFVDNIVVPSVYIAYYDGKYFMYDMKRGVIDNVNIPRLIEAYVPGFNMSYMQDDHQNEFNFDALNMVLVDSRYNMSCQTFITSGNLIRTVFCPKLYPYRNCYAYNNKVTMPSIINAETVTNHNKIENVSVIKHSSQEFSNNDFVGFGTSLGLGVLQFESGSIGNTFVKTLPELESKPNITFVSPIKGVNKTYYYSQSTQRFEEEKVVKWSILKTPANVGDIAYWNGSSVKTVPLSKWKGSLGVPVGVVMIPEGFLPDGEARIISLNHTTLAPWGTLGNTDSLIHNYGYVPLTNNVAEGESITNGPAGYLPTDRTDINISEVICYTDPTCRYPTQGTRAMIPSPYLSDQPNSGYFCTIPGGNALNDFYGLSNTRLLMDADSDAYRAASLCWNYKDPANSNLQWYLPAMGELAFLMPRFAVIRQSILAVGGVFDPVTLWSSTEWTDNSRSFSTWILWCNGFVTRSEDTYMNYEAYPVAII